MAKKSKNIIFDELNQLQSLKEKFDYCNEHIGEPIENGFSRCVFEIDNKSVLKLAKSQFGKKQNENEANVKKDDENLHIFPNVTDKADDFSWIMCEKVEPATEEDFQQCLGMGFGEWSKTVRKFLSSKNIIFKILGAKTEENINELCETNENIKEIKEFVTSHDDFAATKLFSIKNYGVAVRNKKNWIVILYGEHFKKQATPNFP